MKSIIEIVARNPASIAIAIAGILTLAGQLTEASAFLLVGILFQGLWVLKDRL